MLPVKISNFCEYIGLGLIYGNMKSSLSMIVHLEQCRCSTNIKMLLGDIVQHHPSICTSSFEQGTCVMFPKGTEIYRWSGTIPSK